MGGDFVWGRASINLNLVTYPVEVSCLIHLTLSSSTEILSDHDLASGFWTLPCVTMKEDHPETPSKEGPNAVKDMSVDPVETSSSPSSKTSSPSSFKIPYPAIWKHLDDTRGFASDKLSGQFKPAIGSKSKYKYCTPDGRESRFVRKLNFGNNSNIWLVSHQREPEYVYITINLFSLFPVEQALTDLRFLCITSERTYALQKLYPDVPCCQDLTLRPSR